jgi:hypothetical protein
MKKHWTQNAKLVITIACTKQGSVWHMKQEPRHRHPQVRADMLSLRRPLLMLQPPRLQTVMMKFPFHVSHPVLPWFSAIEMTRIFSAPSASLFVLHFFALHLLHRLVAVADALLGMVNIDLHLLLLFAEVHYGGRKMQT